MSVVPNVDSRDPEPAPTERKARIGEIDGLRGIALTLVVVFHLFGQGRVSGGVDVFLFISGVVLALSLMGDVARRTQGRVLHRWVRTFGRLAPPAALVLIAVVVMAYTVLAPWNRSQTLLEAASAGLYFENWQLIWSQLSYEAAGPMTSPVQHFWSLSIQGQLLIVVPLVVAAVYMARSLIRRPGVLLWGFAVAATAASFVYALYARSNDEAAAYFDSLARTWEFGLGVLVGGAIQLGWRTPAALRPVLGWLGLFGILVSGFVIDGASMYPGPAALIPVGGAALVVLSSGGSRASASGVLESPPLRMLNKYSYALYLWHWPVLIAYLTVRGNEDGRVGWKGAAVVLIISVVLAILTQVVLERPLQEWFARRAVARDATVRGVSKRAMVVVLMSILLVPGGTAAAISLDSTVPDSAIAGDCSGAAAFDPQLPDCGAEFDPSGTLMPLVEDLRNDVDSHPGCWSGWDSEEFNLCSLGPSEDYERHILTVGDSHNFTLIGVYEQIAEARNWRIDFAGRASCHWTTAHRHQRNETADELCRNWNNEIDELVASTDYDAIIVMNSSGATYRAWGALNENEERTNGFVKAWQKRLDHTTPVIAIRDNPLFPEEALECVRNPERIAAGECALPRDEALHDDGLADAVAKDPYAQLVDLTDYMCTDDACPLVVGGVIVLRDGKHLTATFAHTLAPYLDREFARILNG